LNDNIHASSLKVRPRSLPHIIQFRIDIGNDMYDARYGARSSVLRARIMIVMIMFLAMRMAMVVPLVVRLMVFLLGHPKSHASVVDNAPELADALQCTATGVLCLV
jgi:hypothetical protein